MQLKKHIPFSTTPEPKNDLAVPGSAKSEIIPENLTQKEFRRFLERQ
jgi:hypothetical protein